MLLEGHGRKRESTGIRSDAKSTKVRQANRAAAEGIYHARMVQLGRAKHGLPTDTGVTFKAFSVWYETHHTAKHRGADRERLILERLRRHFNPLPLAEIRPARWQEYHTARLRDGVGVNTIGRELSVMKALLNAAVGEHLEVNPLASVKRKTERLPPKRTITAAEDTALLDVLAEDRAPRQRVSWAPQTVLSPDRTPEAAALEQRARRELHDLYIVGVGTLLRQQNLIDLTRAEHQGDRLVLQTKTGPHVVPLTGLTPLQRRA